MAEVYRNGILAGTLIEDDARKYSFEYDANYFNNANTSSISLTMPKSKRRYEADYLFPFFFNMLSEGVNRKVQSRQLQISEKDHFGLLLATSSIDTIGAITVKEIKTNK